MEKIKYLKKTEYELPIIKGDEKGLVFIEPFFEFSYTTEKHTMPSQLAVILKFSGDEFGYDLSFSVRMVSYFMINDWLRKNDIHKVHLKMIALLTKYLTNDVIDIRIRNIIPAIPTLEESVYLMGSGYELRHFVLDFPGN
ncbi:MAG TPA: hypothetical protein VGN20_16005 [Mucilaginibacter sp.]|jgi:hypothetical protein